MTALEAGEPRLLAFAHPTEEGLIGLVEARRDVLQDVAVEGGVLLECQHGSPSTRVSC